MILSFINIRKIPREVLKTEGEKQLLRALAKVNEWKIMFDPYIFYQIMKSSNMERINSSSVLLPKIEEEISNYAFMAGK